MDLRRFFLPMRKEAELEETESSCGGRRRALEVWSEERKLWGEHLDSDADLGCRMEFVWLFFPL